MRALAWAGAVVVALGLAVGASAIELHVSPAQGATTSTHPLAVSVVDFVDQPSNTVAPAVIPAPSPSAPAARPQPKVPAPTRPPTTRPIVVQTTQQALINRDRAAYGLAPLTWSSCLYNVALSNARRMASQEYISHTNGVYSDLACGVGHQSGENVGFWSAGIDDSAINNLFMASSDHKANILGPYHYVATAWVVGANGYGYIAVEFD